MVALCHFLCRGKLWVPDLRDAHLAEHLRRAQETPYTNLASYWGRIHIYTEILFLLLCNLRSIYKESANYSSKLISLEIFTVKAQIRSSLMKQHYAVITLFPFLSYLAPESLSGPVCIISFQLTVYQKPPWAYNVIYSMWCTVQFLLYTNAGAGLRISASSCSEEERRAVADGPVLSLSNQQADKQPWPFTFEKRGAVISTARGDGRAADGMVQLAFSCRTFWTSHG